MVTRDWGGGTRSPSLSVSYCAPVSLITHLAPCFSLEGWRGVVLVTSQSARVYCGVVRPQTIAGLEAQVAALTQQLAAAQASVTRLQATADAGTNAEQVAIAQAKALSEELAASKSAAEQAATAAAAKSAADEAVSRN